MADVLRFPASAALGMSDEEARTSALDTTASWIVEAPAGSGKTGLLMQRYLKLLGNADVGQPEEVLAITFTRKATAELRARVLEQLQAAHDDVPLPREAPLFTVATRNLAKAVLARGWALLENPNRLRIRTIDSLCGEIAGALPLLSGSGAGNRPVEDADPLYRQAARRTLMHLGGPDRELHDALYSVLLHRDGSLNDCEALLARMLAAREQWAELVPLDRGSLNDAALEAEVRPRLERALANIVCAGLTRAVKALPPRALNELTELAQRLSIEPGYKGAESPIAFCGSRYQSPEAQAEHLDHWLALIGLLLTKEGSWRKSFAVNALGFTVPKEDQTRLKTLIQDLSSEPVRECLCSVRKLPPARYPDDQWQVAKALFRLLLHALAELKVLFAEGGECDFAELALAAREALETEHGGEDLEASSGASLRHLLVDEMQDTSSAQYRLLELLTRSWDGHSQTLFLVGDPKQSIYLFRQARVERFLRTMREEHLGDVPLKALRLTTNFRSQAALVHNFNRDFSRIFPAPGGHQATEAGDVPFVEASAVREPSHDVSTVWHATELPPIDPHLPGSNPRNDRTAEEAREIRSLVERWRKRPLPEGRTEPWRIAVLARARNHLAAIVAEFQRTDEQTSPVPFRAVKVEALGERQEVLDVLALTRALIHPADRAAWLAVLHSPWCGLGLADLLALTGDGAAPALKATDQLTLAELVETRKHLLSSQGQTLIDRAWPVLRAAQGEAGRQDIATLVERTWRTLGGDVVLNAARMGNVQRYFTLLRELQQPGGRVDLRALARQLGKLYAEPAAHTDAVDLMTIHNAKGLEWDLVLVPGLEKRGQISRNELLNWLELDAADGGEPSVVLAPIQRKGEKSTELSQWLRGVSSARETAEQKRLLYVACTRAREELHLFAAAERSADGELRPATGTLLESFWPAAAEHFAVLAPVAPVIAFPAQSSAWIKPGTLALAAAAEAPSIGQPPMIQRLPLGYDPAQRFVEAANTRLPYPEASTLRHEATFDRPEGSFAVRAFGNVVHRFLQVMTERLESGSMNKLLTELPAWQPRVLASLRGEGLSPAQCAREAQRAIQALTSTLGDSTGQWLLSPHASAGSESSLTLAAEQLSTLRVDRTFLAGPKPGTEGDTLWIVDFKTTETGSRSPERFAEEERAKYSAQLQHYAESFRAADGQGRPIMVGLYYPLAARLIHWPA